MTAKAKPCHADHEYDFRRSSCSASTATASRKEHDSERTTPIWPSKPQVQLHLRVLPAMTQMLPTLPLSCPLAEFTRPAEPSCRSSDVTSTTS